MKIFILSFLFCVRSLALDMEAETISDSQFASSIDRKLVVTDPGEKFVKAGGEWEIGTALPFDLKKCIQSGEKAVEEKVGGKEWRYHRVSFESGDGENKRWMVVVTYLSNQGDLAVVLFNMKGEMWPLFKSAAE